jgi:hypothetical protein
MQQYYPDELWPGVVCDFFGERMEFVVMRHDLRV